MIQTTHVCGKCQSSNIIRNGHNQSGNAQYLCKDCGTCRVLKSKQCTKQIDMDALIRTYEERNSYRSTGRIFGISHVTVYNLLKKKQGH
jgi:transposase-like protein